MSRLLDALTRHMGEHHDAHVAGFTFYQLMAEHLMLHQYEHGIPDKGTAHDLDHDAIAELESAATPLKEGPVGPGEAST